jgi:hypothetical protein
MAQLQTLTINDTGNLTLPTGTTAQRPNNTVTIQSFTAVGTTSWLAPTGVTSVEVLVVAGGGGGGRSGSSGSDPGGGGGGGGGLVYNSSYQVVPGTGYTVTVGNGGSGASSVGSGTNGGNSVFDTIIALGGGGGGGVNLNGLNGGSGGGGGGNTGTRGFGTLGQGQNGGDSDSNTGGGGGGAGRTGSSPSTGGQGLAFSISGSVVGYAGGGGGGQRNGAGAAGGLVNNVVQTVAGVAGVSVYGGGSGGNGSTAAEAGLANRGGGGGGSSIAPAGTGSSGVVILRYSITPSTTKQSKGQLRVNSTSKSFEYYRSVSKWQNSEGLVVHLDAGDNNSYSGSGSTWTDISGFNNNCVFVNTPTHTSSSPGYFTFNPASPHYGVISNNESLNFAYGQTLIIVMRHTYTSGRRNPYDQAYGGWGTWTHEQGNNINNYIGKVGQNGNPYIGINSNETPRSVWNMMVTSRGPLNHTWYRNGIITRVTQHEYGILDYTWPDIRIGTGYAGSWEGDMSLVMLYNRELSQSEVTKIYQDISTRYGI